MTISPTNPTITTTTAQEAPMTELATRNAAPTGLTDGTLVRITVSDATDLAWNGHEFDLGQIVRLANDGRPSTGRSDRFEYLDGHDYWFVDATEYEVVTHQEGVRVRVTDREVPHLKHSDYLGAEGVICRQTYRDDFVVNFDDEALNNNRGTWTASALEIIGVGRPTEEEPVEEDEAPQLGRPTIDFSGSSRATAREYAAAMPSAALDDEANAILADVASGRAEVDAYALNRALLSVMRLSATRFRNSFDRREFTTKVAHLGHIVQAVLENHADRLPAYEKGIRSRRIETLEGERAALTQAASDERRRLCAEIDSLRAEAQALASDHLEYKAAADAEISRLRELVGDRTMERDDAETERDTLASVIDYSFELLPVLDRCRVLGYWDGLTAS